MSKKDIRWRQRYENFKRAYHRFDSAIKDFDKLSVLEKRNLLAHTYDEERFLSAVNKVKEEYYPAIIII